MLTTMICGNSTNNCKTYDTNITIYTWNSVRLCLRVIHLSNVEQWKPKEIVMTQEELIKKAAEWLYLNLNLPEEEKQWWINDLVEYIMNE